MLASLLAVWLLTAAPTALLGAVFLVLLLPLSLIWNRLSVHRARWSLHVRDAADTDTPIGGEMRLSFGFWRPLGDATAVLTAENRLTGETQTLRVPFHLNGKDGASFSLRSKHCGSIRVHASQVRLYDWAGLFYISLHPQEVAYCTVLPQIYTVRPPAFERAANAEETTQTRENVRGNDRTETVWLREYAAGDAIGGIHWKLSSKLDKLIYREPGAVEDRSLLLYWDRREGSPDVLDALAGGVFSMAQALLNACVPFTLGFMQDGAPVLQRIADSDTLYRTLPLLLRRDRESGGLLPDASAFGAVLWFTAGEAPQTDVNIRVICCSDRADAVCTPQTLRRCLQETE